MADKKDKDKERKKALPPISLRADAVVRSMPGAAGGGAGSSSGLAAVAAGFGGKVALMLVLGALAAGAYGVGKMIAPAGDSVRLSPHIGAPKPPDRFSGSSASGQRGGDGSSSGLSMITGAADAGGAASAAAPAAAAAAPAEAAVNNTAPVASGDLASAAANTPGGDAKKSTFATKFGALSQGLGGGHAAGATLNGGSGLAGGVGMGFDHKLGGPKAFGKNLQARATGSSIGRVGTRQRGAMQQLARASSLSRAGAAASGETSSALAGQAFTGAGPAPSAITGMGASGQTTSGPGVTNGPVNPTSAHDLPQQAPPQAHATNVSPWQKQVDMATYLLLAAGVLLFLANVLAGMAKKSPASAYLMQYAKMAAMLAAALGVAAAALGMAIMKMGQQMYGMIFIGGGALISILSIKVLLDDDVKAQDQIKGKGTELGDKAAAPVRQGIDPNTGATLRSDQGTGPWWHIG